MLTLARLGAAIALTFVFAFAAVADCQPPGTMDTPPCSSAQITPDDPVVSTEPSESVTSNSAGVEISVTALDVLLSALSLF